MATRPSPFSIDSPELPTLDPTWPWLNFILFYFLFESLPPFAPCTRPLGDGPLLACWSLPRSLGSRTLMDHTVAPSAFPVGLNGVLCQFVWPQINGAAHRFISCSPPLSKLTSCRARCCLLLFSFPDFKNNSCPSLGELPSLSAGRRAGMNQCCSLLAVSLAHHPPCLSGKPPRPSFQPALQTLALSVPAVASLLLASGLAVTSCFLRC